MLLAKDPAWTELLLRPVRALYTHRLRGLVAVFAGRGDGRDASRGRQ